VPVVPFEQPWTVSYLTESLMPKTSRSVRSMLLSVVEENQLIFSILSSSCTTTERLPLTRVVAMIFESADLSEPTGEN
jgi:hypothetical protein